MNKVDYKRGKRGEPQQNYWGATIVHPVPPIFCCT